MDLVPLRAYFNIWVSLAVPCLAIGVLAYNLSFAHAARLTGRRVALTFDDGPSPETPRILDILRDNGIQATFFVCGANAERHPELIRRIVAEGHRLGNHTYSHPHLCLKSRSTIAAEIDRTQMVVEKITGRRPTLFRPPYGVRWFTLPSVLRQRGLNMVLWSNFPREGNSPARDIVRRALAGLSAGDIILLHDGRKILPDGQNGRATTTEALPKIIEGIRRKGYGFTLLETGISPNS
jgi:peptidoglycan/xylan/chitin deacetylase (PgdA/CDA1 family)